MEVNGCENVPSKKQILCLLYAGEKSSTLINYFTKNKEHHLIYLIISLDMSMFFSNATFLIGDYFLWLALC